MLDNPKKIYNSVQEYLNSLKSNLRGCDRALIQDALSDAEEYFKTSMDALKLDNPELEKADIFQLAVDDFGNPEEIAEDYRKIDKYLTPALAQTDEVDNRPWWQKILMIIADPKAWGAVLYMIISLVTGIIFFTWVTTGLSISLSLLIFIIGLPIAGLYLLSIRGIALVEGRIVEALLGVRMPRRAMFIKSEKGLWNRFVELLSSGVTWKAQLYMIIQLGLGIVYFTLIITLFAVSLSLIVAPFVELIFEHPIVINGDIDYTINTWFFPFISVLGALLLLGTLHLAKLIGRFHGWFAKLMLVHK